MIIRIWANQHWEETHPMLIEPLHGQVRLAALHTFGGFDIRKGVGLNIVYLKVGRWNRKVQVVIQRYRLDS